MDQFAPYYKINGCFIVRNITPDRNKTIKIFNYPILYNTTRDLLQIPGVAEADIRASLLKGELNHKIRAKDIVIECSDIDLLQFNTAQRLFLQSNGIVNGLQVSLADLAHPLQLEKDLLGVQNSINTIFTTETKFIFNTIYRPIIFINGIKQAITNDYLLAENDGPGTGYDTVIFTIPPLSSDVLTIDYYNFDT